MGTGTGFICSLGILFIKLKMNKNGICDTNGILFSYMVPGLISGVLSAIFQAKGFN